MGLLARWRPLVCLNGTARFGARFGIRDESRACK